MIRSLQKTWASSQRKSLFSAKPERRSWFYTPRTAQRWSLTEGASNPITIDTVDPLKSSLHNSMSSSLICRRNGGVWPRHPSTSGIVCTLQLAETGRLLPDWRPKLRVCSTTEQPRSRPLDDRSGSARSIFRDAAPSRPHFGSDPMNFYFFSAVKGSRTHRWRGSERSNPPPWSLWRGPVRPSGFLHEPNLTLKSLARCYCSSSFGQRFL